MSIRILVLQHGGASCDVANEQSHTLQRPDKALAAVLLMWHAGNFNCIVTMILLAAVMGDGPLRSGDHAEGEICSGIWHILHVNTPLQA